MHYEFGLIFFPSSSCLVNFEIFILNLVPIEDALNCKRSIKIAALRNDKVQNYVRKNGKFRRDENCLWVLSASSGERIR